MSKTGNLEYAGQFDMEEARIIGALGSIIIFEPGQILGITIYEDMDLVTMHGEMIIANSHSYADTLPIIGQEKLEFTLQTPEIGRKLVLSFDVYAVTNREHQNSVQTMVLKFCSTELTINNRMSFSASLKGPYDTIVNDLMLNRIGTEKPVMTEPTFGEKNLVVSDSHPFEVVQRATISSITEAKKLAGYQFFENFDGFQFRSISSIFKDDPIWTFSVRSPGLHPDPQGLSGRLNYISELRTITSFNLRHNDHLLDEHSGVLGSTLILHDIYNKKYTEHRYDYFQDFYSEEHIGHPNSTPIYPRVDGDYSKSKTYYQPISIKRQKTGEINGLFPEKKLSGSALERKISQRNSQQHQLDQAYTINCAALGHTNITVGSIVELNIPRAIESELKTSEKDLDGFFSGKFLIKRIRHKFTIGTFNHEMLMTLVRDSMSQTAHLTVDDFFNDDFV